MTLSSTPTSEILRHPEGEAPAQPLDHERAEVGHPRGCRCSCRWSRRSGSRCLRRRHYPGPGVRSEGPGRSARSRGERKGDKESLVRRGATGPSGPAGTVSATSIVASTALKSPPNPAVGAVLVAKTSCPSGKVLLSGGAQVSAPGVKADRNVELRSSYPLSTTQWQTVAIVTGSLGAGGVMTMRPYVVCGLPTPGSSASTATTTPTT